MAWEKFRFFVQKNYSMKTKLIFFHGWLTCKGVSPALTIIYSYFKSPDILDKACSTKTSKSGFFRQELFRKNEKVRIFLSLDFKQSTVTKSRQNKAALTAPLVALIFIFSHIFAARSVMRVALFYWDGLLVMLNSDIFRCEILPMIIPEIPRIYLGIYPTQNFYSNLFQKVTWSRGFVISI